MTIKQKMFAWLLIALSYISSFATPLVASYFYLAKDKLAEEAGKGGAFFYIFVSIVFMVLVISLTKLVNKMKANVFKSIFKTFIKLSIVVFLMFMTSYVSYNFAALQKVLGFTVGGMALGSAFEIWAVAKYGKYFGEVGVL